MLTEKYRPKKFTDIIGQKEIVDSVSKLIKSKDIPSMLFVGPPGCGKTTLAWIVARERFPESWRADMIEFNASDDRGIDTVRNNIKPRAFAKGQKIIFLDEVDNMTHDAQAALRRIMEDAPNTTFILSANREYKIMDAIKSRCAVYHFNKINKDVVLNYLIDILKKEGIKPVGNKDEIMKSLESLTYTTRGDLRSALNTLSSVIVDKEFHPEFIVQNEKPKHIQPALKQAVGGNIEYSIQLFEDAYLVGKYTTEQLIEEFYEAINELDVSNEIKARLYINLREVDDSLVRGGTPLIQFIGFLYFAYVAPHLKGVIT